MDSNSPASLEDYLKAVQAYAEKMGPTAAEQSTAKNMGLLQFGLSAMANVRKPTLMGLGEAGQQGLLGYTGSIEQQQKMRAANLAQAGATYNLAKNMQNMDAGMAMMREDTPASGVPSMAPQGMQGAPGGMPGAPGMPGAQGAPDMAPGGPPNMGAPGGNTFPTWKQTVARGPLGMILASGDMKATGQAMLEGSKLTVGRNGELIMGNMLVGRAQGEGTIIYPGGDVSKAYYIGSPPDALVATANQAAAVKGKETAAAEAAKFPYDIRTIQNSRGEPQTGFTSQLLGAPPGAPGGPAPSQDAQAVAMMKARGLNNPSIVDVGSGGAMTLRAPGAQQPGVMGGPNPVEMAGKEAYAKQSSEMLVGREKEINEAGRNGAFASARWSEMQKLGTQFDSGALTPFRSKIAATFNALGADPETVKAVAGGSLPAIEGFGKLSFESALNQIKSFSSRPAAQEVVLALQNNPNVSMTVQGRNLLMATNKALADYNVQMMKDMAAFRRANGTTDGFEAAYYDSHPPEAILPSQAQIEQAVNGTPIKAGASTQTTSGWSIKKL